MRCSPKLFVVLMLGCQLGLAANPLTEDTRCHGVAGPKDSGPLSFSVMLPGGTLIALKKLPVNGETKVDGAVLFYKNAATLNDPKDKAIVGPFSIGNVNWKVVYLGTEMVPGPEGAEERIRYSAIGAPNNWGALPLTFEVNTKAGTGSHSSGNVSFAYQCDYDLNSNER
jgi:hypothetical protein